MPIASSLVPNHTPIYILYYYTVSIALVSSTFPPLLCLFHHVIYLINLLECNSNQDTLIYYHSKALYMVYDEAN